MWSLRLLVFISIMGYVLYKLWKNEPFNKLFDHLHNYKETPNRIIQNKLFSAQTTPFNAYEWQDVHVQSFYGDHVLM